MKVTKLIREYIEDTVAAKIPYGEPSIAFNEARDRTTNIVDKMQEMVEAYAKSLIDTYCADLPEGFSVEVSGYRFFTRNDYKSPMRTVCFDHEREIRLRRDLAVKAILLELELGAAKADLERIIAAAVGE